MKPWWQFAERTLTSPLPDYQTCVVYSAHRKKYGRSEGLYCSTGQMVEPQISSHQKYSESATLRGEKSAENSNCNTQSISLPPFTLIVSPVMNDDESDARNNVAFATSSGDASL